ncbi:MAG: hypothetical protein WCL06_12025 [Bacteroidota bacterium]
MTKLKIKLLAHKGADTSVYQNAIPRIDKLISPDNYEIDHEEVNTDINVLFFLSGGSEQFAIESVSNLGFYILIGSRHDNSYASATEVKALLDDNIISSVLLDEEDDATASYLNNYLTMKTALENLKGKRIGLIGEVSDWLVASNVSTGMLFTNFRVTLVRIPWKELKNYSEYDVSESFLSSFAGETGFDLTQTARVSQMLNETIKLRALDAITVECFPMVKNDGVTACLPLSQFNDQGIPAGCEGDLTAIIGMMLCKELTGTIPWIANINKVSKESCLFSHCTIARSLVTDYSVLTHFETGKGTAIEGDFKGDVVTIFRFDRHLSKAFIATAPIIARPRLTTACRTQIEVKLNENDVKLLRENPLGNHHLIYPGDCSQLLEMCCQFLEIEVLK